MITIQIETRINCVFHRILRNYIFFLEFGHKLSTNNFYNNTCKNFFIHLNTPPLINTLLIRAKKVS